MVKGKGASGGLKDIKEGVYVLVVKSEEYHSKVGSSVKHVMQKWKSAGIYAALNTSYERAVSNLEKNGVDTSRLFFITCKGAKNGNADNCISIKGAQCLTEFSLTISKLIVSGKFNFLVLDSVSTLLVYNDSKMTEKFIHYLVNKLKNQDINGVLIILDDTKSEELIPVITQFCDGCIRL